MEAQASRSPRKRREEAAQKTVRSRLDPWLEGMLGTVVVGSVLAVGTVHVPVLLVVATLSIATGVLSMVLYHRVTGQWPVTIPALGMGALGVWTALQAIPMPAGLLAKIAPHNAEVWARALEPLGLPGPSWVPISLDPGATWIEVLKAVSYVGIVTAATVVSSRRGAVFGVGLVFLAALAAGLTTIAHGLLGLDKVFGLYEPVHRFAPWHIGPLLNANHLAGYLNLGALCGLGLLLMQRPAVHPGIIGVGVAAVAGVSVASAARGAVVLLPVGMALTVLLLRGRASRHSGSISRRALHVVTLATGAGAAVLALLGMTTQQWDELASKDLSKLEMLTWSRPLVLDHPLLGIGRGAFETVYPAYRQDIGNGLWTHPENILVQWTSEWGIAVAVVAAVFFAWLLRPSRVGAARSAVAAGAWSGILVLVVQNWVDFSLEVPSVAIAVVTLIGTFWGDTKRRGAEPLTRTGDRLAERAGEWWGRTRKHIAVRRGLPYVYGAVGAVSLLLAAWRGMPTPAAEREHWFKLSKGAIMHKDQYRPIVERALRRHPADPYFPLAAAYWAWHAHEENAIPYIERALERSRVYGRAHLLLAEILFARGANNQALMELKFATHDDPAVITPAVGMAIEHTIEHDDLARMVPESEGGAKVLDTLGSWLHSRNPQAQRAFDQEALKRDGSLVAPRNRLADFLMDEVEKGEASALCGSPEARKTCAQQVEMHAMALERSAPDRSTASMLRVRALEAEGKADEADKVLADTCDRVTDRLGCIRARVQLASRRKDHELAETLLKQIAALGCTSASECSRTNVWIGDFEAREGNLGGAATAYDRAAGQDSSNADAFVKLARTSVRLGMWGRAAHAYERAVKLKPGDADLKRELETARTKVLMVP